MTIKDSIILNGVAPLCLNETPSIFDDHQETYSLEYLFPIPIAQDLNRKIFRPHVREKHLFLNIHQNLLTAAIAIKLHPAVYLQRMIIEKNKQDAWGLIRVENFICTAYGELDSNYEEKISQAIRMNGVYFFIGTLSGENLTDAHVDTTWYLKKREYSSIPKEALAEKILSSLIN